MFLKRAVLSGFKSFCDRVEFDFGPGITCVVGPNGCGKSNLVDAFKWVLGEQSARSLRGRQMIDMIFNGSSTRKAGSVARVDLTFDNADHTLPCDHAEVTISRKLYRSGESEYLLNQQATRLKDIRELFMDTGVGADAYSVIEQGKVDSLLQSSPTDRRIIFEEAAGISKYKARKREAQRKLERTDQNLLRVADVVEELEKRLRSVKLAAGKARRFKEYEARLNELRSSFAMAEFHRFSCDIDRLSAEIQDRGDQATGLRTDIDRHEAENSETTIRLDRLANEIASSDNQLVQAQSELATQQERIAAARQREEEQHTLRERSTDRLTADQSRLLEVRHEFGEVQQEASGLQNEAHELERHFAALSEQDKVLAQDLTCAQATLEDEKSGIIDLLRRSAAVHNEIIRLNTHRESLLGQKGRLSKRGDEIHGDLQIELEQRARLERRLHEVEELIESETQNLERKKADAARAQKNQADLERELAAAKEKRSAIESRHELLEDLDRRMDGIGAGVRRILDLKLQATGSAPPDAVVGLVADIFDTDVVHARIVQAAVGNWDQYLVVSDTARFRQECEALGELPGRVTVFCLDRLPPIFNERDFSDQPGFVARAVDLVRYDDEFEQLAHHLLGKTVVVEDLDAALTMAARDVARHRFVTLDGEVVEPDGRLRLGPNASDAGLISRKSELRDLAEQKAALDDRVRILADQLNRSQADIRHLEDVLQELRAAIYESNTAKVEANATLQKIAEAVDRLQQEQPLVASEVAQIEQQIDEVLGESEAGGRSLEALERENQQRERNVQHHEDRMDAVVAERREVQEKQTQARVDEGQLAEKRKAAADRIHAFRRAIQQLQESISSAQNDIEQYELRVREAKETAEVGQASVASLTDNIAHLEGRSAQLRNDREVLRLDLDGRTQTIKTARARLSEMESELHDREMTLAKSKVRRDDLIARVREEMNVDLVERYAEYEHSEQDWEQVETEIAELRQKMDRLGNVNLDAIDELRELEERHAFLTGQCTDLRESQRQLQQLIDQLNAESQERFREAFDSIRGHFRTLFRKLFGGGRADIVLEDPDDILECGIEIVAQPPGKDLQSISLMSGGEKSMTAIALLMSIFKNRPAPFAFLDEVDAALDEANNDRFNRIVREFVDDSQFIIITHSKRTMTIADRLYGITMQEPGVSTRVSVQLSDTNVA
ncbi:MAG: chromosome segregation protein SMC [Planctomycetes bacterium]|nr:chromosome segregation protein SMC [Planctomycetota bacterium]